MSSLFGGGSSSAAAVTPSSSLRVQTSVQGAPVPICYGQTRLAGNLLWYGAFTATPIQQNTGSSGKGGIGGGTGGGKGSTAGATQYSYAASLIIGICEGLALPLLLWNNTTKQTLQGLNFIGFDGDPAQGPWPYLLSLNPGQALTYRGICTACAGPLQLGDAPQLPNLNFEVISFVNNTSTPYQGLPAQPDANAATVVRDYLINPGYGVSFPASYLGDLTNYGNYCLATGFMVSTAETTQRAASDFLNDIFAGTNSAPFWSSGKLQVTPYGDMPIVAGAQTTTSEDHLIPQGNVANTGFSYITVGCPGTYVGNVSVVYAQTGAPFVNSGLAAPTIGQYQIQGIQYIFNVAEIGTLVTITYTYAAAASYTPPQAPEYDLDDDSFVPSQQADAPVEITRTAISLQYNSIKMEYLDRSNDYNPVVVEVKDDAAINLYGYRPNQVTTAHYFALAGAAQMSAALMLGRQKIMNTYVFTVGPQYILLDPMDIVSLTDFNLGMFRQWVRITEIQENSDKSLTITAEEYLEGTGNAPIYGAEAVQGPALNYNVAPGDINAPIIFEPGVQLAGGFEIWVAVSGVNLATWGGCYIYVSYDNVTYQRFVNPQLGSSRMGVLLASLGPVAGAPQIDNAHVLNVNLAESGSQLASATVADLINFASLCYVDGELLAYENATPTGTETYQLTTLNRGAYGTQLEMNAGHASATSFARLDAGIFRIPFTADKIGSTVFIKFCSFNIYGGAQEGLADVSPFTYIPSGEGATVIAPTNPHITSAFFQQPDGTLQPTLTITWTASTDPVIENYEVQWQIHAAGTWDGDAIVSSQVTSYTAKQIIPVTFYDARVRAIRTTTDGNFYSTWAEVDNVKTIFKNTGPNPPTGLTGHNITQGHYLTWTNPADTDFDHVEVWKSATDDSNTATIVSALIKASSWTESVPTTGVNGPPFFFWLKAVNTTGVESVFSNTEFAGVSSVALVLDNTGLGAGAVQSLNLTGNAVTVPATQFLGNPIVGTGATIIAASVTFTIDTTGLTGQTLNILITFFLTQGFTSAGTWEAAIIVNGSSVESAGGASTDVTASLSCTIPFTATGTVQSFTVQGTWAANSPVTLAQRSINCVGFIR